MKCLLIEVISIGKKMREKVVSNVFNFDDFIKQREQLYVKI